VALSVRRCGRGGGGGHAPQVFGQVGNCGITVLRAFRQRLQADTLQLGWEVLDELPRRLRLVLANLAEQLPEVVRPERQVAGKHLVEHYSQAVDVGAGIDSVRHARNLLWRHVPRGAE
jgi:hypothetical protein